MTESCPICLESLDTCDIISICCITPICSNCATDLAKSDHSVTCLLCGLPITLGVDVVDHPVIQQTLRLQSDRLKTVLSDYQTTLERQLTRLQTNQSKLFTNMAQLLLELATTNLTEQLELFYRSEAKALELVSNDLTAKLKTVKVRTQHFNLWLQRDRLPLSTLVLVQEWRQQIRQDSDDKITDYHRHCWYRHPQARIVRQQKDQEYLIRPQLDPSNLVTVKCCLKSHWSLNNCFLDNHGHVRLYRRITELTFTLQLIDLTSLSQAHEQQVNSSRQSAVLTLNSPWPHDQIDKIEMVATVKSGYLIVTLQQDSPQTINTYHSTGKLIVLFYDHSGVYKWSQELVVDNLVQVYVYNDKLLVFGTILTVWRLVRQSSELIRLDYQACYPINVQIYHPFWSNEHWLYFAGDVYQPRNGEMRFYRFDLTADSVLTEITDRDVIAEPIAGLRWYQPIVLPGLTLFWKTNVIKISHNRSVYDLCDSNSQLLYSRAVVPLPDYWGRLYEIVDY